ncbi:MAG: replicative helicase [Bacteroidota bacterium]|jgi:replicative DNA helicase|nr:replicative DNA helicase [Flavobacteriia bacterium]
MDAPNASRKPANRAKIVNPLSQEIGRIPPQAVDLEQVVLGAMMLEKTAVNDTIDILSENSFYDPKHQYIYKAIRTLFAATSPVDLVTVTDRLSKSGELSAAGGAGYISQLTNRVGSTANVQYHARIIAEKFIKRELIRVSNEIIKDAFDDTVDVFELLNGAERNLFQIGDGNMSKQVDVMSNVVRNAIEEIEVARKNADGISGIPSGFVEIDQVTAGWQRSDMIVIAARPGMGKTAFVLSAARNTALQGFGVAIFSLEMSSVQLVKRLIAGESRINSEKLRKGDLADHEFQQLHSRIQKLAAAPLYIDDTAAISIFDFRAKCRRLKAQYDIQLVIIDYLQLMSAKDGKNSGNREQEISMISRSIKEIAKELNIPIIALSQLSRSVEQRSDKKPILSDLRESGAIEQDADIVSFLYRPSYYKILKYDDGTSTQGIGEFLIEKHRNGKTAAVRLRFEDEFARFSNLNEPDQFLEKGNNESLMRFNQESNTVTIQSKMNQSDDDFNFQGDQNVPF